MTTTLDQPSIDTTQDIDIEDAFREITGTKEKEDDGTGDHERFSHYVSKEDIVKAETTGVPVRALCGKKWTPSRNPDKYPVCPDCERIHKTMKDE